jgi:hypothetical protein
MKMVEKIQQTNIEGIRYDLKDMLSPQIKKLCDDFVSATIEEKHLNRLDIGGEISPRERMIFEYLRTEFNMQLKLQEETFKDTVLSAKVGINEIENGKYSSDYSDMTVYDFINASRILNDWKILRESIDSHPTVKNQWKNMVLMLRLKDVKR